MSIQWFPGHMASVRKKAAGIMEFIDVVIEVLDARANACRAMPDMVGCAHPTITAPFSR